MHYHQRAWITQLPSDTTERASGSWFRSRTLQFWCFPGATDLHPRLSWRLHPGSSARIGLWYCCQFFPSQNGTGDQHEVPPGPQCFNIIRELSGKNHMFPPSALQESFQRLSQLKITGGGGKGGEFSYCYLRLRMRDVTRFDFQQWYCSAFFW